MQITINIAGGSSTDTQPPAISDQSPDSLPVDAGASPALQEGADTDTASDLTTYDRAQACDAGAPPASLLEEVEAAALAGKENTTKPVAASTDEGEDAGTAPV